MTVINFLKEPADCCDYHLDWSEWLAGDIIVSSTWQATGSIILSQPSMLDAVTSVWVSGGIVGEEVELTNHIVTLTGRDSTDEDEYPPPCIRLLIRDESYVS